jgi:hypothetical protein
VPAGNTFWLIIPYYGRKFCSVRWVNWKNQVISVGILGVNFGTQSSSRQQETTLQGVAAVGAAGGKLGKVIRASVDGVFDALVFSFSPAVSAGVGPIPTQIVMSDDPL